MNGVIDQSADDALPGGVQRLNHAAAWIVKLVGVVIKSNLASGFPRGDLQSRGSAPVPGLANGFGRQETNAIQILEIAARFSRFIGKTVAIRSAVGVAGSDQNVIAGDFRHQSAHPIPQHGRKSQEIDRHQREPFGAVLEYHHPGIEIAPFFRRGLSRTQASRDRQEWLRCQRPFSHPHV